MSETTTGTSTDLTVTLATEETARFDAALTVEGERTTDGRFIERGALIWRELPIPLTNAADTGDDHAGAVVGRIESIERVNLDGERAEIRASGSFDLGSEAGREAARLVSEQVKRWVSIDAEPIETEFREEGDCEAIDGDCVTTMVMLEGRIMGAAIVAFPAFPGAVIVPAGKEIPPATEDGRPDVASLTAHAGPNLPPAEWFDKPSLAGPTPITITEEGRVYGHIATFDRCHVGFPDSCKTAPRSKSGYAYFLTGTTTASCDCDGGTTEVQTGTITLGTGHAPLHADARKAAEHYDDTGSIAANVTVGEDAYGIWFAGALASNVSHERLSQIKAAGQVSGDWRPIGGSLELVAVLAVPVPGFPIPRARVASGDALSLVAAGMVALPDPAQDEIARLAARIATLEHLAAPLVDAEIASLMEGLRMRSEHGASVAGTIEELVRALRP